MCLYIGAFLVKILFPFVKSSPFRFGVGTVPLLLNLDKGLLGLTIRLKPHESTVTVAEVLPAMRTVPFWASSIALGVLMKCVFWRRNDVEFWVVREVEIPVSRPLNVESVSINVPTPWPLLLGPPACVRGLALERLSHDITKTTGTYASCNNNAGLATNDRDSLHRPAPVLVDLHGSLAIEEKEVPCCKLLVPHVGTFHCIRIKEHDSPTE